MQDFKPNLNNLYFNFAQLSKNMIIIQILCQMSTYVSQSYFLHTLNQICIKYYMNCIHEV